uniref:Galectin n=1 Tax=Cyprinus carpio TaxID=7962 RepID=A0A8C2ECI2_CYPCA
MVHLGLIMNSNKPNCKCWTFCKVDLMHGSDIVLHFNPRYEGGSEYVVHNTCHYGHWGSEERKYETPFPRAQTFALQILVTQETYKVIISYFIIYNELQAYFLLDRTINQSFCRGGTKSFLSKSQVKSQRVKVNEIIK